MIALTAAERQTQARRKATKRGWKQLKAANPNGLDLPSARMRPTTLLTLSTK